MRAGLRPLALLAALAASAPFAEGADAARPRVAVSATPARIAVAAPGARAVRVRNVGRERVVVEVGRRGAGREPATTWLRIVPRRLALSPGGSALVTVRVVAPRRARPGDHHAVLVLTTQTRTAARVPVRMRLGIKVRVRTPGPLVRRVVVERAGVLRHGAGRTMRVALRNVGNVTVPAGERLAVALVRHGAVVARLRSRTLPELLPGARTRALVPYAGRLRGPVTAIVVSPDGRERRFRLRL